jgi:hypothetical protein
LQLAKPHCAAIFRIGKSVSIRNALTRSNWTRREWLDIYGLDRLDRKPNAIPRMGSTVGQKLAAAQEQEAETAK